MSETPKISVIIPSYNHEKFVGHAIQSVLDQTFSDFELLISDDCSQDGSRKVIESFSDPRIHTFFQEKNLGPVYAIQFLNRQARGHYIALLNSDDYWAPEKLAHQIAFLDAHSEIGACFTQGVLVDENERVLTELDVPYANVFLQPNRSQGGWLHYFWESGNALSHMSILARREVYAEEFQLNPALRQIPDMELWMRLIQKYPIEVLQEPLFYHRRTTGENQNTSAVTLDNSNRNLVEEAWSVSRMMIQMSDALLLEGFSDMFINKHAATPLELRCERFFLMRDHRLGLNLRPYMIAYFMECSMAPEFVACMETYYHFSLSRFFKLTGETACAGSNIGASKGNEISPIGSPSVDSAAYEAAIWQYQQTIHTMQTSTCWRITRPIRILGDWLKNLRKRWRTA